MLNRLYKYTIYPLECIYKVLYLFFAETLGHYGLALILLSLLTSFIIRPFMKWAASLQKEEKRLQDIMKPQIDAIKAESKGAEQYQRIQRMYKRYGYHPVMAIRSAVGVMLQIPFLMAAFYMLSKLPDIQGVPWGFIRDLGKPDGLLLGRFNVLPFVMTAVNLLGAYTTKGFSKRDRMQAVVIAVLFLVLLYPDTQALLTYWTCNNLWTLLGNVKDIVFARCGISVPSFRIRGKRISEWLSGMPDALYVCLGLALTVCVLIPADVYLVNSGELWFTLRNLLKYLIPGAAAVFAVLAVLYYVLRSRQARAMFVALVLGLLIGFWLQSYVINLDYGILDGRTIRWSSLKKEAALNCIAWAACIIAPFIFLKYQKAGNFLKTAKKIAVFLLIVQVCSAFYTAGNAENKLVKVPDNIILTTEEQFTVSSKDNLIVFVLDAFESKTFRDIQVKNPELIKPLNGFTYYPDATSFFGYTDYSVPQMLTNKVFTNQSSYKDFVKDAWGNTQFFKYLQSKNYDIRLLTFSNFLNGAEGQIDNLEKAKYVINKSTMKSFTKLALFREMPHILKKHFKIYSGVLRDPAVEHSSKVPYKENDIDFYNELKKGLQVRNDKNCFKFYHLNGAHVPYTMNADIQRVEKDTVTIYEQSVGALKIVLEFIDQLKKNKVYDNATIAILSDHGKHNAIRTSPLVLIKQPNASDNPLVTRNNPISFSGLHATLLKRFGEDSSQFGTDFDQLKEKRRTFYIVQSKNVWDLTLVQYTVDGYTEIGTSWKKIQEISRSEKSEDNSYSVGTKISFSPTEKSYRYVKTGWEQPIFNHRWINAEKAVCSFSLNNYADTDLKLIVWAYPSLKDKASSRNISVYAGNKKVCTWHVDKSSRFTAKIPKSLINPKNFVLVFKVENPVSKKFDKKRRAIAVKALQIK